MLKNKPVKKLARLLVQNRLKGTSIVLILVFLFSMVGPYLPLNSGKPFGVSVVEAAGDDDFLPIGDLPIGTRVVDQSWTWGGETWTWIVVDKNFYHRYCDVDGRGTVTGGEEHVTLLLEGAIPVYAFDNSGDFGHNHWGKSGGHEGSTFGIRKFLNGSAYLGQYFGGVDFIDEHEEEHLGHEGGLYEDLNSYTDSFYDSMSKHFQNAILTTYLRTWCNHNDRYHTLIECYDCFPSIDIPSGGHYETREKVFLPSLKELGNHMHGAWVYFAWQWVPEEDYYGPVNSRAVTGVQSYFTRDAHGGTHVLVVGSDDNFHSIYPKPGPGDPPAYARPVINVRADTGLSALPIDGVYHFIPGRYAAVTSGDFLTEAALDGARVEITLEGTEYTSTLDKDGLTLQNAPAGITIASVTRDSDTVATLTLAYPDTAALNDNVTDFTITVSDSQHSSTGNLTTGNITISMMTNAKAVQAAAEALQVGFAAGDSAGRASPVTWSCPGPG